MAGGRGGFILGIKRPEPEPGHSPSSSAAVSNLFTPRKSSELARLHWGLPATTWYRNISRLTCTCTQRKAGRLYMGLCLWDSIGCAVNSVVRVHVVTFPPHPSTLRVFSSPKTRLSCIQIFRVHISTCVPVMLTYSWFSSVSRQMPEYYIKFGHYLFLTYPIQFCIHLPFCLSTS
jgi:hypothetical protein